MLEFNLFRHKSHWLLPLCGLLSACSLSWDDDRYTVGNLSLPTPPPILQASSPTPSTPSAQQDFLEKLDRLLAAGGNARVEQLLKQLPDDTLSEQDKAYKQILQAQLALNNQNPNRALNLLKAIPADKLQSHWAHRLLVTRALALEHTHTPIASALTRIRLARYLPQDQQAENTQRLWSSLMRVSINTLMDEQINQRSDRLNRGWLNLAMLNKTDYKTTQARHTALSQWEATYPLHPARTLLQGNKNKSRTTHAPSHIALLLPLSGKLDHAGSAIRDGFMAGYYAAKASHKNTIQIKIYDTANTDFKNITQHAIDDGADFIVGPLAKNHVDKLIKKIKPTISTLTLNYSQSRRHNSKVFQFGLSPVDEAKQIAKAAHQAGKVRALVIRPESAWGNTVAAAFNQAWQDLGAQVRETITYGPKSPLSRRIRDAMYVNESYTRQARLKRTLGKNTKFVARRRQDIDMIFLLANPADARKIRPLIKFHFAGDLPIYATSLVYSGEQNIQHNRDLDGITFPEIPWLLSQPMDTTTMQTLWGKQRLRYARLYALGLDAYTLASRWDQVNDYPQLGIPGKTGLLTISKNHKIHRQLQLAKFKQGKVQGV